MPYPRHASYWEALHFPQTFDAVIVGGGVVGLQAALYLTDARPDLRVAIVERDDPPAGASTRNAGYACIGSLGELADDIRDVGLDATVALVRRRARGLQLLRERVGDERLRFEACGNLEWFRAGEEAAFAKTVALLPTVNAALMDLGAPFAVVDGFRQNTGLAGPGGIVNRAEGQLDPGAMMRVLQQNVAQRGIRQIRAEVRAIDGDATVGFELATDNTASPIHANACMIAVNGFAERLTPASAPANAVRPARNQVIVTAPVPGLTWRLPMHLERGYGYLRRIGDRVLVGGFRHRFPPPTDAGAFALDADIGAYLREVLREVLPKGASTPAIDHEWSGTLGLGPTRSPEVTTDARGIVYAVGLGGMGVALGSLLGQEAAGRVLASW